MTPHVLGEAGVDLLPGRSFSTSALHNRVAAPLGPDVLIEGMFTGSLKRPASWSSAKKRAAGPAAVCHGDGAELAPGDSLAVNGVPDGRSGEC